MSKQTIFEQVKEKASSKEQTSAWYRKQVRIIAKNYTDVEKLIREDNQESLTEDNFQDTNRVRNNVREGHLYLFEYKATKKYLPYYDQFPLVYVTKRSSSNDFFGTNLHYINPKYRYTVIKNLIENDTLNVPKITFHKYLDSNVLGRFLDLGKDEWYTAIYLPIDNFIRDKNGRKLPVRKDTVWNKTYENRRYRIKTKRSIEDYSDEPTILIP